MEGGGLTPGTHGGVPAAPAPAPALDWAHPWLQPLRAVGEPVLHRWRRGASGLARALDDAAAGVRFVAQQALPAGEAYESFIARTGTVPTRDNLHDFFNGLVWRAFPQAKRRLNDLQAAEIARRGIGPTRGPLRDALTLFDENGAVLEAPPALWEALLARDWTRLFIERRAMWGQARLLVFGHALMEKLLAGRKDATAHVLLAPSRGSAATPSIAPEDAALAAALQPVHLAQKPFTPLPLLGVPGWCEGNEDFCFYDDPQVFRPRRSPEKTTTKAPVRESRAA